MTFVWSFGSSSLGQPLKSRNGPSKEVGDVFADSPVDAIATRIKQDLKELPPSIPPSSTDTPQKTTTKPSKATGAAGDSAAAKSPIANVKPFKSSRVKGVETNAQKCQIPDEAVVLYKIFLADPETTDADREEALPRLEVWEQAATDDLTRIGPKWIPKKDAEALHKDADKLVAEALELLNIDNFVNANAKLELAGKTCPEHQESVFLLAVGAYLNRDYKAAEAKFSQCLARAPSYIPLLNNVAVCEVQLKRFEKAVKHWEKAATIDPEHETIAQNLGQFVSEASTKKIGNVERRVINDATDAYQRMISKNPRNRSDSSRGFILTTTFRTDVGGTPTLPEEHRIVGNGTGIVVADGYVLTHRSVVDDAEAVVIQDPLKPDGLPLAAKVVATAAELEMTLLSCRDLQAPAVPFDTVPQSRGAEIVALGFPTMNVIGKGLKATRGTITGVPSTDTDSLLVLDIQTIPGTTGGPVCDKAGRVVGVVSARASTEGFSQRSAMAVPTPDVYPFLKQQVKSGLAPKSSAKSLEWTDVEAQVGQSTVMVIIQKKR